MTSLAELNKMNETRNYLIDIRNNYKTYTLYQIVNKIDDRYDDIQKLANRNIMISEKFNEAYSIAYNELIYGSDHYDYMYVMGTFIAIITTIIDYNDF